MRVQVYLAAIAIFLIGHNVAQAQKTDQSEEAALRAEIRQQLRDSIRNAQSNRTQFTNNENIDREALNIKYTVQEILLNPDQLIMGPQKNQAISLEIPETKSNNVKKAWTKHIKHKTKSKISSDSDGISINGTVLERISPEPINVYSSLTETDYGVKIVAAFEEKGKFIAEGTKFNDVKGFMRDFGVAQYKEAVKEQVKGQKKVMKDMESKLDKLQRDNEKKHKVIKENELSIINTENNIKENLLDQDRIINEMQGKKTLIASRKGDAKKTAEKELKDLEKEKKKLQGDHKSMQKKIVKYRAEIEETRREIELNLSEQDFQKQKISKQLSRVKSLEEKLASVK